MKILLQRVSEARVEVYGKVVGEIAKGVLLFVGVTHGDTDQEADRLIEKVLGLRIFEDSETGKYFDKSVQDLQAEILVVSQFTLYARTDKGRRPDFGEAEKPEEARNRYEYFVEKIKEQSGLKVESGQFQAHMMVHLVNDGPVTLVLS